MCIGTSGRGLLIDTQDRWTALQAESPEVNQAAYLLVKPLQRITPPQLIPAVGSSPVYNGDLGSPFRSESWRSTGRLMGCKKNFFEAAHEFGTHKWRLLPNSARQGSKDITLTNPVVTMASMECDILKLRAALRQEPEVIKLQTESAHYYTEHTSLTILPTWSCNWNIQNAFLISSGTPSLSEHTALLISLA